MYVPDDQPQRDVADVVPMYRCSDVEALRNAKSDERGGSEWCLL